MDKFVNQIQKKTLLKSILTQLSSFIKFQQIRWVKSNHQNALKTAIKKNKLKVAFFLIHESVWKYDGVYKLLANDIRFDPIVVVCPYIVDGEEAMILEMNKAFTSAQKKGFNVIKTYDETTKQWLDVKKEIKPDLVFFSNPHKLTKDEYYIDHFKDCLTCYVPYNFGNSHLYQLMYNQLFHNYLWRLFAETEFHKDLSKRYAQNGGKNVIVTGYPGVDLLLDQNYIPENIWKQKDDHIKKIIWAPHHTIDDNITFLSFSSFLIYADFMVKLVHEYFGKIQIALKPHPLLFDKLCKHPDWGKERTKQYYNRWKNIENGQLVEGDYLDLFLTSDAMMHDSGSFLIEYLYTCKPVLHINRDEHIKDRLNDFGILAFNQHYHAKNELDIIEFIEAVLNNKDEKKAERETFLVSKLLPPNQRTASENIYNELINQFF
jgi:hypothetical protein